MSRTANPECTLHTSKITVTIKKNVTSVPVGSGIHAVRVMYEFDEQNEFQLMSDNLMQPEFAFVVESVLSSLAAGYGLGKGISGIYLKLSGNSYQTFTLDATTWPSVVAGTASVIQQLRLNILTLTFDLARGVHLPCETACPLISKRIRGLPPEAQEPAVRAVLGLPYVFSVWCSNEVSFDERVKDALRRFRTIAEHPISWNPSEDNWKAVMDRMDADLRLANPKADIGRQGLDGRTYPWDFMEAVDRAMLALHPEVAALLEA